MNYVSLMSVLRVLMMYIVILTPSTVSTQRDAAVAGSMVKLISSRYEINTDSSAKDNAENAPQSWIPSFVNRYKH